MQRENNIRSDIRRSLVFYLPIIDRKTGNEVGELGDITKNGLLLISEQMLTVTETKSISIELPKGKDYSDRVLNLIIEIMWTKRDPHNPQLALSGCRIKESGEKEKRLIDLLIRKAGFSNGQKKICFNASEPDFMDY